jgi:hypothetical protein
MRYHTDEGNKTVLVGPKARKKMPILVMGSKGLTVKNVPLTEERYLSELPLPPRSRGISTVIKRFKMYGNRNGATKAAKSFINKATNAA